METLSVEDWLQSIWQALRRLERKELSPFPAPVITVDPPDLTDIVTAVTSLHPGPTAEEIAEAIARVLTGPVATPAPDGVLAELVTALEKLDFRLQGVGTQAYGGGSVSFAPGAALQFAEAINSGVNTTEARLDYAERIDDQPVYVARAATGTTTAQSWTIEKITYDEDDRPIRKQVLTGAWDDRASLNW